MGKVSIILGSTSDKDKMAPCYKVLKKAEVPVEVHVFSAHRTPEELKEYVKTSSAEIFIAGAGMAAALPGVIASYTNKPVIGVPLSGGRLGGVDALLAISQMPKGVPVATVAIDGAENAGILALQILGVGSRECRQSVTELRDEMRRYVLKTDVDFE